MRVEASNPGLPDCMSMPIMRGSGSVILTKVLTSVLGGKSSTSTCEEEVMVSILKTRMSWVIRSAPIPKMMSKDRQTLQLLLLVGSFLILQS